ncbi:hypothetical protein jhhlp_001989 [Lomentospora prolificans]|uniref:C2H2-type domain-containing protein n=1 Tax=Lomentospora prolificans TaxID=41688 RepID=A0A2N3NCU0_9PEZI|nr:hypothetical protein jhhlp_001989 [Lomentospora prolificans]
MSRKRGLSQETSSDSGEPPAKRLASSPPPAATPPSSVRSDDKKYSCDYPGCTKAFNRPSRLTAHQRSHTGERPFVCDVEGCDKSYMEEKHLQQHVKGTHEDYRPYTCSHCGKTFGTSTRLQRHEAIHTRRDNQLRCTEFPPCERSFKQQSALERHIRSEHLNLKPYLCKEQGCDASYDSAGALRNHTNREHAENKFWCEECPRPAGTPPTVGFTTKSLLQAHMRNEHMNCIFCPFKCSSKYDLNKHIEVHHSGMTADDRKHIVCDWPGCDKKFTKRSNLNVHIRVAHEGHRFICGKVDLTKSDGLEKWSNADGCGRDFASKANLEDHVRHLHLGMERQQRPSRRAAADAPQATDFLEDLSGAADSDKRTIECPGCEQKFIRHYDLQLHLPSHDGPEKPAIDDAQTNPVADPAQHGVGMPIDQEPNPIWTSDGLWQQGIDNLFDGLDGQLTQNYGLSDLPIDPALNSTTDWTLGSGLTLPDPDLANTHLGAHMANATDEVLQPFNPPSHNEWMAAQQQSVDA